MADEDIKVTIDPEISVADDQGKIVEVGKTDAKPDPVAELKAQVDALEKGKEASEKARIDAEQRAANERQARARAEQEAAAAKTQAVDSELETVLSGLEAAKTEASSAESEYQQAMEAGDFGKAAKAQRKMAQAEARAVRLDEAKADIEARKASRPEPRQAEAQTQQVDPIEAFINSRTEPTAKWLRAHKDWVSDDRKNARLTAAHYNAMGEGIPVDTPEYFDHVETFLGLKEKPKPNGSDTQQAQRKKSTAIAAPVQQSGGGTSGNGVEVRLTRAEATAATDGTHVWNYDDPSGQKRFRKGDPIGVQEFARRKNEMTKQGLYDKSYVEA